MNLKLKTPITVTITNTVEEEVSNVNITNISYNFITKELKVKYAGVNELTIIKDLELSNPVKKAIKEALEK